MATDILVVDDEQDIRELVAGILEDEGHGTRTAGNSDTALEEIRNRRPSMVFLDIWLQDNLQDIPFLLVRLFVVQCCNVLEYLQHHHVENHILWIQFLANQLVSLKVVLLRVVLDNNTI